MIDVSALSVRFGDHQILDNISFHCPRQSLLAVMGPNGSGKSTLLRTIAGLVRPSSGSFHVATPADGAIGYVPQIKSMDRTFPARSIELVATALKRSWPSRLSSEDRALALHAMKQVGAEKLADRSIGALSGGELQRIYLARAIMRKPEVLLLDEPETGVDSPGTRDLHALLDEYRSTTGACIVMVTHDWEVAFHHATHVALLNGRLISFGTPADALSESAVRQTFGHIGHEHTILGRR